MKIAIGRKRGLKKMNECVRPYGIILLVSKNNLSLMLMLMLILPCSQLGCKFAFYINRIFRASSFRILRDARNHFTPYKCCLNYTKNKTFFDLLHRNTTRVTTQSNYIDILQDSVVMKEEQNV